MQLQPGSLLQGGKYKIVRAIGQGGFGITYEAMQTGLERRVAVKEFFMRDFCERGGDTPHVTLGTRSARETVEHYRDKFIKEAKTIAAMEHPNIIRIHDIFEENGTAYYVMEHIGGGSLRDKGGTGEAKALRCIRQVADALQYIHAQRIMHLDVKPSNILLRPNGDAVLIDFGISKRYDANGGQTSSTPVGISKGYAPMEQYNSGGVNTFSPTTDIYALGATLYFLLTGQQPPEANVVSEDGLPPMPASISLQTRKAIEAAMQPRRKDRPQDVAAFLALLPQKKQKQPATPQRYIPEETLLVRQATPRQTQKQYDEIGGYCDGFAIVQNQGKYGFIDKNGKEVVPCKYDDIFSFCEGLARVKLNNKWGFIDSGDNTAIPFIYDYAGSFMGEKAYVRQGYDSFYIDKQGNKVE